MKKYISINHKASNYFIKYSTSFYWMEHILNQSFYMTPRQWINSSPTEYPLKKAFVLYLLNIKID